LRTLLTNADLEEEDIEEYLAAGVKDFESTAKQEFNSPETVHYINFRDTQFTDTELSIRRGRMTVQG
jgi:hypothetical protein